MKRALLSGAALLATLLAGQLTVQAERNVHVPGTACNPRLSDVSKIQYNNMSAVNEATSSAKVACPFMYQTDWVNKPSNLFLRVIDRSTSANVSCTVYAFAFDDLPGTVWQKTATSVGTSDPDTGNILQDINAPNEEGIQLSDAPGLVFTVTCTLPASSTTSNRSEVVDYQLGQGT